MTCGIYCIENVVNGKKYIGKSITIETRYKEHISNLTNKNIKKDNRYLVFAWHKHGKDSFKYWTVEECPAETLDEKEKFYIQFFGAHITKNGYNLTWGGDNFMAGQKLSEEHKHKISLAHIGRKKPKEAVIKSALAHKGKTPWLGKTHTFETKEKIRLMKLGVNLSEDHKNKISNGLIGKKKNGNNNFVGVHWNDRHKRWVAILRIDHKKTYIGEFTDEKLAALAYDKKCFEIYKNKELLNFPELL